MKKFVLLAIFGLVLAGFIVFSGSNSTTFKTALTPLKCDLNITPCEVKFKGKNIKFEFADKNIKAMQELTLVISNANELGFKNPSLRAFGLNMDMGNMDIKLKAQGENLVAKFVLSACMIDVMRYRFEILDDGRRTGLYTDFDLKF